MFGALHSGQGFSFGEAVLPNGGTFGPLRQPYTMFLLLHEGAVRIEIDGKTCDLAAGECGLYVNRSSIRLVHPLGLSSRIGWCETPLAGAVTAEAVGRLAASRLRLTLRIGALFQHGLEMGFERTIAANRLRNALGEALLAACLVELDVGTGARVPMSVLAARSFADANFVAACDLQLMAKAAGLSPEHLVTSFRRHLHTTPIRYVWELRTRKAIHLVQRTGLSLVEIAGQCGYSSPFHLSRQIKQMTGLSPRDLRRMQGYAPGSDEAGHAVQTDF